MTKKPNNSDFPIRLIKMRHGETLIARIKRIDDFYVLKDPMTIIYVPYINKDGNMESTDIAFRDWIEGSTSKEYHIPADSVLIEVDCDFTIRSTYEKILLESENQYFFESDYMNETMQFYNDESKPQKKKKKPSKQEDGLSGPSQERLEDGEDDLDSNGWDDFPPRFKI